MGFQGMAASKEHGHDAKANPVRQRGRTWGDAVEAVPGEDGACTTAPPASQVGVRRHLPVAPMQGWRHASTNRALNGNSALAPSLPSH